MNDDEHYIFMALRIGYCYVGYMYGTKRLNQFFRLYEASEERATLIVGKKGRREIGKCFTTTFSSLHLVSTLNVGN